MLSNSTYDAQINQLDRRWIAGGRVEKTWRQAERYLFTLGTEFRYDDIGNVGLQSTNAGQFVGWLARHAVREASGSVYAEGSWNPTTKLRLNAGLRGDYFNFDVKARESLPDVYSGNAHDSKFSPKIGAAYVLTRSVEAYASWGRGFHSNDARGVINHVTPIPGLSPSEGYEAGARFEFGSVKLTTTYWWLNLDSELKFVGDSNSVEPGPATRRRGYELTAFWRPVSWVAVDAVWTGSRGRYVGNPDGDYIPGALESVGELGIAATSQQWDLSARLRYLGDYPLIEDNSHRAGSEYHISLRGAWKTAH
jgi:outer membrane receptor protein involved in Fe transport